MGYPTHNHWGGLHKPMSQNRPSPSSQLQIRFGAHGQGGGGCRVGGVGCYHGGRPYRMDRRHRHAGRRWIGLISIIAHHRKRDRGASEYTEKPDSVFLKARRS